MDLEAFCDLVRTRGRELYRDLPWRRTYDPYAIWISEVMLQQTQVSRVMDRWQRWLERFPTVDARRLLPLMCLKNGRGWDTIAALFWCTKPLRLFLSQGSVST